MVSVLAFYSNDPSLNHTVSSEICVFKRTKISKKEAGIGSGFENVTNVLFHFVPKTLQCKELQKHFFAETRERERERERDSNPGFGTDINLKRKRQIASLRGRIFATATTATNEGKRKPREREKFLASNERSNFDGENETKFGKLWNAAE